MRRSLMVCAAILPVCAWLVAASCSNPLEVTRPTAPEPVEAIDSVIIFDTLTICDTLVLSDSVVEVDTVVVTDSVYFTDTVQVVDTVRQTDTLAVTDSVYFTDTVQVVDTVRQTDTLVVTDSVILADTVFVVDTLVQVDTVVVTDPGECPGFCSQVGSHQKEVVWLLQNSAGHYRLDFAASVERGQPQQTLIVEVGGRVYRWSPATGDEYSIETDLAEHAQVRLTLDNPKACGHQIDVCLKVTPL